MDQRQRRLYDRELEEVARLSEAFAEQEAAFAEAPNFVMTDPQCGLLPPSWPRLQICPHIVLLFHLSSCRMMLLTVMCIESMRPQMTRVLPGHVKTSVF